MIGRDFKDEEFERPVLEKKRARTRRRLLYLLSPTALVEEDGVELGPRLGGGGRTEEDGAERGRGEERGAVELPPWVERIGVALDLEVANR